MAAQSRVACRLAELQERIGEACRKASRKRDDVLLVAVSKFHSSDEIREAVAAGQLDFGENYIQEYESKLGELGGLGQSLNWHFTGRLQRRKAGHASGKFRLIHALDSEPLAKGLESRLAGADIIQPVLIEVNIASEPQKAGVMPVEALELAEYIGLNCPHLRLDGLMCLPPVFDSGSQALPWFEKLARIRDGLAARLAAPLPHLSMGMTGDFEAAIAAGATIIRVGTAIFGPRNQRLGADVKRETGDGRKG